MADWRQHIESGDPVGVLVKGANVEVDAVLRLLRDGATVDELIARFPGLSPQSIRACLDYAAELVERQKHVAILLKRSDEADQRPGLPIDAVERGLIADLPDADE